MKYGLRVVAMIVLMLSMLASIAGAQGISPPATPSPPGPPPVEAPPLKDPADLLVVLGWLVAGGAGPGIAFALAKMKWFTQIKNADAKLAIVFGCVVGVPLLAKILVDFVPPDVWAAIQPYWATAVGALLIGWPLSQIVYQRYIKAA